MARIAASGPSWADLPIIVAAVVAAFYVLPQIVFPALTRWWARRSGRPPKPVGPVGAAVMAAMLVAYAVAITWDKSAGRPSVLGLVAAAAGLGFFAWRLARR